MRPVGHIGAWVTRQKPIPVHQPECCGTQCQNADPHRCHDHGRTALDEMTDDDVNFQRRVNGGISPSWRKRPHGTTRTAGSAQASFPLAQEPSSSRLPQSSPRPPPKPQRAHPQRHPPNDPAFFHQHLLRACAELIRLSCRPFAMDRLRECWRVNVYVGAVPNNCRTEASAGGARRPASSATHHRGASVAFSR
jgi:hypothetical protein